jgi:hypothetical protein
MEIVCTKMGGMNMFWYSHVGFCCLVRQAKHQLGHVKGGESGDEKANSSEVWADLGEKGCGSGRVNNETEKYKWQRELPWGKREDEAFGMRFDLVIPEAITHTPGVCDEDIEEEIG